MKINGIIAEYNPFHNGHMYQLEKSKRLTGADYTVVVMSGDFVQRGAPSLLDKHQRTEMALRCGADLVLELPVVCAVSSADYFAMGAVSLLDRLNVVSHLCFGSECGDVSILRQIAEILLEEPEAFASSMRRYLKEGYSYPNARDWALLEHYPFLEPYKNVLSTPNNILGIAYIKALLRCGSNIVPVTVMRTGTGYHDRMMVSSYCSALALRQALYAGQKPEYIKSQMPEGSWQILKSALSDASVLRSDDFSDLLYYKLLLEMEIGYERYLDVSADLSDRIRNNLNNYQGFDNFCDLLKTKNMTYTRISRSLFHILLNLTEKDLLICGDLNYAPYARILGFRRESTELLSAIKERSSIPLVSKLADAEKLLNKDAFHLLEQDILASHIYQGVTASRQCRRPSNEFSIPIVTI